MSDLPEYRHFSELEVVPVPSRTHEDLEAVSNNPISTPVESWLQHDGPDPIDVKDETFYKPSQRSIWKRRRFWIAVVVLVLIVVSGTLGGVLGGKGARKSSTDVGNATSEGSSTDNSDAASTSSSSISTVPTMSGTATPRTDYSFPTAISHSYPNLDVFAIGTDEALYHKYRDPYSLDDFGPSTLSWEDLGDTNSSQFSTVAAVWRSAADLDVFLVGGDNEMYHKYYSGVTWGPRGGFESREGILTTAPTVVSWDADTLDIFMLGQRGSLWRQTFTKDDGWVNWKELGGDWAKFAPTVVSWGQGRLDYFVVGSDDHALYHGHATTKGTWTRPEDGSLFENRGGYITGRPAAVSSVQGRLDVFARGGDGGLWTTDFQPSGRGWTEWTFLGEDIVGEPEAVSWGPNRIDVFVWKTDFSVGHKYFDGSTWTPELGFENLGGNFSGPPKAAVDKVGSMHVFGYSNKREVLYRSWNEDAKSWVPKDDWKSLGPPR